jgi:hypothetical protein
MHDEDEVDDIESAEGIENTSTTEDGTTLDNDTNDK